jgi:polyisoprenoid-binding protein YceI
MTILTETTTEIPTGTWAVDPVHSQVAFAVDYMGGTFRGTFSPFEGTLEVAEDGGATLAGSAPVSGVRVQEENLTAHLQSPDFFDAERHPEITFASTEIRRSGSEIEVDGEITIRGTSHPIQLRGTIGDPADDAYGGVRFGLELEGTIDRTAFGINWNNPLPSGDPSLANDVTLAATLYLARS